MTVTVKFEGALASGKTTLADYLVRAINDALGGPKPKALTREFIDGTSEIVVDLSAEDIRILRHLS